MIFWDMAVTMIIVAGAVFYLARYLFSGSKSTHSCAGCNRAPHCNAALSESNKDR